MTAGRGLQRCSTTARSGHEHGALIGAKRSQPVAISGESPVPSDVCRSSSCRQSAVASDGFQPAGGSLHQRGELSPGSMSSSGGVGRTPRTRWNASTASQRRTSGFDTSASRMAFATSRSSTNTSSRSHAPTPMTRSGSTLQPQSRAEHGTRRTQVVVAVDHRQAGAHVAGEVEGGQAEGLPRRISATRADPRRTLTAECPRR
jgi:hypothetical protein